MVSGAPDGCPRRNTGKGTKRRTEASSHRIRGRSDKISGSMRQMALPACSQQKQRVPRLLSLQKRMFAFLLWPRCLHESGMRSAPVHACSARNYRI